MPAQLTVDVDGAEISHHRRNGRFDRVLISHVDGIGAGARAQGCRGLPAQLFIEIKNGDSPALFDQGFRSGAPKPGSTARDHGDFVFWIHGILCGLVMGSFSHKLPGGCGPTTIWLAKQRHRKAVKRQEADLTLAFYCRDAERPRQMRMRFA